ncbi:MAG: MFS transporter, partial [Propionibacteriaceae bacterium]|nr:MFS transporter [Propionibacteriaceae bacterium]
MALLVIIYLAFISLGLPDSLLGAAWPSMYLSIGADQSSAGIASFVVCGGTIISALFSNRLVHRFKTGSVMVVSVSMTAVALFGISAASSMIAVCLWAVPLGLGAGCVDAVLNNFVALHYKAKHMSWLHCFWGVGATLGPMVMSMMLVNGSGWRQGYSAISYIQAGLTVILILSIPLWRKVEGVGAPESPGGKPVVSNRQVICVPGLKYALAAFA